MANSTAEAPSRSRLKDRRSLVIRNVVAVMIGVAVGQTNIFFFDADGKQIAGFDIAVKRDLNGVRAALKQAMPDADIRIEGIGDGVMYASFAVNRTQLFAAMRQTL